LTTDRTDFTAAERRHVLTLDSSVRTDRTTAIATDFSKSLSPKDPFVALIHQMNDKTNKAPLHPLVAVAGYCAVASIAIVALAFCLNHTISGVGMWAIAAMAATPSLMGIGIAFFMTRQDHRD
jgi:hypothetical protein